MIKKILLNPKTHFGTPLDSDTLFGHICWAIKYLKGEDKLLKVLEQFNNGKPSFLISSAFPEGYLPRPIIPSKEILYNPNANKDEQKKEREKKKKEKKISFIAIGNYSKALNLESIGQKANPQILDYSVMGNSINRETGIVEEGILYSKNYFYLNKEETQLACYLKIIDESLVSFDDFLDIFSYLEKSGIGKDKNIGKGLFEIELKNLSEKEKKIFSSKGDVFISLSHCLGENLIPLSYNLYIKYGKLGEDFARKGNFYKKPLVFYKNGSCFKKNEKIEFPGEMAKNISSIESVVQYGYAFPLYFSSEVLDGRL